MHVKSNEIGSWVLVTVVTVMIWIWAAGETREQRVINVGAVRFAMAEQGEWLVRPRTQSVGLTIEGSRKSMEEAETLLSEPLAIELRLEPGYHSVSLVDAMRRHEGLADTGVAVVGVEPATMDLEIDAFEIQPARVRPALPGQVEGIEVRPSEVEIRMPRRLFRDVGSPQTVDLDPAVLDGAQPGVRQTRRIDVRLPEWLRGNPDVTVVPSSVEVTFTVRSRIATHVLDSVRVHVMGPHEDWDEYAVELSPKQLRRVEIRADADLVRRIEQQEVQQIFAVLHLSSAEKESRIERKPISYFIAILPSGEAVKLETTTVDGATEPPVIELDIQRKEGVEELKS